MSLRRHEKRALGRVSRWMGSLGSKAALSAALLLVPGVLRGQTASQRQEIPPTVPDATQNAGQDTGAKPPSLQKRSTGKPDDESGATPRPVIATGHTDMSPEAEGRYPWDKHGGEIELYFEDGRLDGYMTEHVDPDPHVAAVTYRFATTHVDGHAVAFATQAIHGVSYSFSGHLERGTYSGSERESGVSSTLPGTYLLTGILMTHSAGTDDIKRTVSLKRAPGQ